MSSQLQVNVNFPMKCEQFPKFFILTGQEGQSTHSWERVISRSVQYVESVGFPADAVHFTMEILNCRRVIVREFIMKEPVKIRDCFHEIQLLTTNLLNISIVTSCSGM